MMRTSLVTSLSLVLLVRSLFSYADTNFMNNAAGQGTLTNETGQLVAAGPNLERDDLHKAIEGSIDRGKYLKEKLYSIPYAQSADKQGSLLGILYEPTDEELICAATNSLALGKGRDVPLSPERLLSDAGKILEDYKKDYADGSNWEATIFPISLNPLGDGNPKYIVVSSALFYGPSLQTERDLESILTHETVHSSDMCDGIPFVVELFGKSTGNIVMARPFLFHLFEWRANYFQLSNILNEKDKGKPTVSDILFGNVAENALIHHYGMKAMAQTDDEKKVEEAYSNFIGNIGLKFLVKDNSYMIEVVHYTQKGSESYLMRGTNSCQELLIQQPFLRQLFPQN